MATKDIYQTHKEYKDRKNRLNLKRLYDERENSKQNEIKEIDDKIAKLKEQREKKNNEYNEISSEKLEKLSEVYNDTVLLNKIIELAEHTTYSRSNLEDIKKISNTGINSDDVNRELIEKISFAEENIYKQIRHTNSFNDLLESFGSIIELPNGKDGD